MRADPSPAVDAGRGIVLAVVISAVVALVAGFAVGVVTTFTHRRYVVEPFEVPVPLGLIAAIAIVAALIAGFRLVFGSRLVAGAAAVGVVAAVGLLALPGAGGTALVLGDPLGYTWAVAPVAIAAIVLLWPARRRT